MDLGSALIAMVSAVVVAGIGYATTKLTSSTQKKTAEVEARGSVQLSASPRACRPRRCPGPSPAARSVSTFSLPLSSLPPPLPLHAESSAEAR